MIFTHLPDDVFSLLSGKAKYLYAEVLLDLFDHFYADEAAITPPERADLIHRISIFADRHQEVVVDSAEDVGGENGTELRMAEYPNQIYYRLRECGWLDEIRDGYRVIVDMPPEILLLLAALQRIRSGAGRNYTGAVTSILASVDDALKYPRDRGAALAEAARQTKDLIHHLRAMTASLRRLEERVVRQPDPATVFRRFFEDFVGDFIVDQYKTLLTHNNPWRHRSDIIRCTEELLEDGEKIEILSDVFQKTENLPSTEDGRKRVFACLQSIRAAFDGIDPLRETIDQFKSKVERRVVNTVRYMERIDREDVNRLVAGISKISSMEKDDHAPAPMAIDLIPDFKPIGDAFLAKPRKKIVRKKPGTRTRAVVDPAIRLRKEAKLAFQRSLRPTPEKVQAFLSRETDKSGRTNGHAMSIRDLDDFIAFDALRRLSSRPELAEALGIKVVPQDGALIEGDWIKCAGFLIEKVSTDSEKEDSNVKGS
jgi:hypothetical protein